METLLKMNLSSFGSIDSSIKGRDLVEVICKSLGLLQEKSKRDVVVDVFYILNKFKKENLAISSVDLREEVISLRKSLGLDLKGTAPSNIRRILKELMDFGFIERKSSKYMFKGFEDPSVIFKEIIDLKLKKIISRNVSYLSKL